MPPHGHFLQAYLSILKGIIGIMWPLSATSSNKGQVSMQPRVWAMPSPLTSHTNKSCAPQQLLGPSSIGHAQCTMHGPNQLILCSILGLSLSTFIEPSSPKVRPQPNHPASGWAMRSPWTLQHPSCTHGMPSSCHGSAVNKGAWYAPVPPRHNHVKVVTNHPHLLNSTSSLNQWMNSLGP